VVGRAIGRRRFSLLGLRPRRTAQVITVITGVLITVTTLLAVLALSREARVALFRLNEVLRETRRLESEIKTQEDRLRQLALGDIAYLTNQEVVRDVIDGRARPDVMRQRLGVLVERAEEIARDAGIGGGRSVAAAQEVLAHGLGRLRASLDRIPDPDHAGCEDLCP